MASRASPARLSSLPAYLLSRCWRHCRSRWRCATRCRRTWATASWPSRSRAGSTFSGGASSRNRLGRLARPFSQASSDSPQCSTTSVCLPTALRALRRSCGSVPATSCYGCSSQVVCSTGMRERGLRELMSSSLPAASISCVSCGWRRSSRCPTTFSSLSCIPSSWKIRSTR